MTAETVDCPACAGWGKFHLARCVINPGGRQYAHTVQSDATERSATVDGSHQDGPGSDVAPVDARQDHLAETDPAASAFPTCTCRLTIHNWRSGHGTLTTVRNMTCPRHGEDVA